MNELIMDKLARIEERISRPGLMRSSGAANELGYYIFDYDPAHELLVRGKVEELAQKYASGKAAFAIRVFDLYELIIDLLKEKGYWEKSLAFEGTKGLAFAVEALVRTLRLSGDNLLVRHIADNTPDNTIVFLTGVGKCYPVVRAHNIINTMQQAMDSTPVVLFYPGRYRDFSLSLFGTLMDGNHYRALPLID